MRAALLAALFMTSLCIFVPFTAKGETVSPKALLDHIDDLFRGESSFGTFSMKVVTEHYTREMKMEGWSKGKDYSLIRILSPRKEKGTATLKAARNIWNYLPKIKRVIKIPSSMMGGAWMGSHFTNDDLVKESRMSEDYTFDITFQGDRGGMKVIDLTLVPKENAAVVWGKVVATVSDEDWMPLQIDYYDEDMELVRIMTYGDVKMLGGRRIPARMAVRPVDKDGEFTEVVYHGLEFDVELDDEFFTLRNLQKIGCSMSVFRIAWRNLWRNWKRTAITFGAVTMSTAVLISSYALMLGWTDVMKESVTDLSVGEVQVHNPDYRSERSIYDTVDNPQIILDKADEEKIPASARTFGYGLLSVGTNSAGAQFWGVIPEAERAVSDLQRISSLVIFSKTLHSGRLFWGGSWRGPSRQLSTLSWWWSFRLPTDHWGMSCLPLPASSRGVGEGLDRSLAIIHRADFEELFVFSGHVHEIVLNSRGAMDPDQVAEAIHPVAGGNEVMTWRQLMPTLSQMFDSMIASILIFGSIFFLAAGVGVLNTMLMATYERIPEFGLIKAIGATPWRIMRDVSCEAMLLGFVGGVAGGITGTLASWYFQHHPIDLTMFVEELNFSGIAVTSEIPFSLTPACVWGPVLSMWLASVLAALWPAIKAARLRPVEAMTHV